MWLGAASEIQYTSAIVHFEQVFVWWVKGARAVDDLSGCLVGEVGRTKSVYSAFGQKGQRHYVFRLSISLLVHPCFHSTFRRKNRIKIKLSRIIKNRRQNNILHFGCNPGLSMTNYEPNAFLGLEDQYIHCMNILQ